jgi:hypothetical protein
MSHPVKSVLDFDVVDTAEKISAVSGLDKDKILLSLLATSSEMKKKVLTENSDSYMGISFLDFQNLALELGFKEIFKESIQDSDDILVMMWNSDGILLRFESFWDNRLNSAEIYFNYRGPRGAMMHCSSEFICDDIDGESVWAAHCDVRQGFRYIITNMQSQGKFLPTWLKQPFLWLLNYNDTAVESCDHHKINNSKISKFPIEVQKAILSV